MHHSNHSQLPKIALFVCRSWLPKGSTTGHHWWWPGDRKRLCTSPSSSDEWPHACAGGSWPTHTNMGEQQASLVGDGSSGAASAPTKLLGSGAVVARAARRPALGPGGHTPTPAGPPAKWLLLAPPIGCWLWTEGALWLVGVGAAWGPQAGAVAPLAARFWWLPLQNQRPSSRVRSDGGSLVVCAATTKPLLSLPSPHTMP